MATNVLFCLGLLIIAIGIMLFFRKKKLYRDGIRTIGKIIELETYTYLNQGPEFNTVYYIGITPIIEVEDSGKKIRIAYNSIDDYSNLSKGDEVEVIYPKGKVEELLICNEKELYKGPLSVGLVGLSIIILALILILV